MNKNKLYKSLIETISKQIKKTLKETIDFNNSDIFNKEDSYYDDSNIIDNYTYNKILEKLKNAEQVTNEEWQYIHEQKYKVTSKKELRNIIKTYSEKNPIGSLNWIDVSNISDMSYLFSNTNYYGDVSEWDLSNVNDTRYIFYKSQAYENIVKKLKSAESISKYEQIFINKFKYVVNYKKELRQIVVTYSKKNPTASLNWIDTSKITDMSNLFSMTKYNGDISEWNVSNVTDMGYMFYKNILFNQPIVDWDISNITKIDFMFCGAKSFNQPIGNWNVSHVTTMCNMFSNALAFNQPLGDWDVSNVIDISFMFFSAKSFNQNISNWDVGKVQNTYCIFYKCPIKEEYKPKNIEY